MARILLYGTNPKMGTGMGIAGREVAKGLATSHDVHYYSPQVSGGPPEEYEGFTLHGSPGSGSGQGHFNHVFGQVEPDLLLTNQNWQGIKWLSDSQSALNQWNVERAVETPVVYYGPPVESEECPPWFEGMVFEDHLNDVYAIPYTASRYDQYVGSWGLEEYTIPKDVPGWVPHGVDHDVFYPGGDTREAWREITGIEDRFIVQFVGENWRRKNLDVLLEGFSAFKASVGGNPILSLHTPPSPTRSTDQFYSGWHLPRLAAGTGLEWETDIDALDEDTDVFWTSQFPGHYVEKEKIATFIDAADVYALPTSGEAFSLTTLEAMACGTPVVQTDVKTLRWLSGEHAEYITPIQSHRLNSGERQLTPSTGRLASSLGILYGDKERCHEMAEGGHLRANDFSWERTGEEMRAAVEWILDDTGGASE